MQCQHRLCTGRTEPTDWHADPGTSAPNSPLTIALGGTGIAATTVSPTSLSFGNVAINTPSAAQTATLTNYQASSLSISSLAVTAGTPYAIGSLSTCLNPTLAAGATGSVILTFNPTTTGAAPPASLTITDSANNSPQTVTLTGTGIVPVTALPTSLIFGNVAVNATSAIQTVTVTNNQAVNLNISSITQTGPFAVTTTTTTCAVSTPITPGNSCVIGIVFQPKAVGATIGGQISISDNANNSPQVVGLSGTGIVPVTLNPSSLAFSSVEITNTVVKNVTLTNNQSVPLNIASITGFPAGFSLNFAATTCVAGNSVAAGGSCVIAVSVTPTAAEPLGGTITVNDDANTTPQTFTVSATVTAKLIPSPLSLSFAAQVIGTTSAPQTITLTNPQSVGESITGATITGANASDFAVTTTCPLSPATLPAGASCPVQVTFTPSGSGTRTATLNVGDPLMIPLTGAGSALVTVLPGLQTYTAPVGTTSAYQTVTITNMSTTNALHISNLLLSGDLPRHRRAAEPRLLTRWPRALPASSPSALIPALAAFATASSRCMTMQ